jgi:prokaryotic ubiquitin-like protein Pup
MATNDKGGQRQTTRRTDETEEDQAASTEEVKERHEKLSDDVDAILDEIDEVLEENAEEWDPWPLPRRAAKSAALLSRGRGRALWPAGKRPVQPAGLLAGSR